MTRRRGDYVLLHDANDIIDLGLELLGLGDVGVVGPIET